MPFKTTPANYWGLCAPSQKGMFSDFPQPHKENRGPCSMGFPSSSVKLIAPLTTMGPAVFLNILGWLILYFFTKI